MSRLIFEARRRLPVPATRASVITIEPPPELPPDAPPEAPPATPYDMPPDRGPRQPME